MGVQGLWQILEPAAIPVDPKSLKGKVLAVDTSIWLHQLSKGFRDKEGNPIPNAHLLGIFYRLCKLLSYGIKPVFVFDGGVPILKKQTLANRRKRKIEAEDKSEVLRQKILANYVRQQLQQQTKKALPTVAELEERLRSQSGSPKKSPTKRGRERFDEVDSALQTFREKFKARTTEDVDRVDRVVVKKDEGADESSSSEDEGAGRYGMDYAENFNTIVSKDFDVLPLETQHEILFEMQDSRKMNSWGKMEVMPKNLHDFSNYQMDRLVKRRFLQKKIQSVQKEMGQKHMHVQNLDELLKMDYNFDSDSVVGSEDKGFVLIQKGSQKDSKEEISPTKIKISEDELKDLNTEINNKKSIPDLEEEKELAKALKMSLQENENNQESKIQEICETRTSTNLTEEEEIELAIKRSLEEQPTKETKTISDNKKEPTSLSLSELSKEVPSTSSCLKFLDTIGFSSRAPTNAIKKFIPETEKETIISKESESSDNESDFEEVDDTEMQNLQNKLAHKEERQMVNGLLKKAEAVTTIEISPDLLLKPVDNDIFADIFENEDNQEDRQKEEDEVDEQPIIEQQEQVNGDNEDNIDSVDWGSDPELEIVDEMENKIAKNSQESEISTNENKSIDRTLGKMPHQSKSNNNSTTMITASYLQAQEKLNNEQIKLMSDKGSKERAAGSISDQMSVETQELLSLFGVPYIVSPMEAESQCAFLDAACLTDGTITDDSDCWLFGSLRVYKNFYSAGNKPVEFYQLANITKKLNLDREKLVLIAMLSGGDYTEGLDGVGPVTALEILSEFPTNDIKAFDTLVQFRDWWDSINDPNTKVPEDLSKMRTKLKKLQLRPSFPSEAVWMGYMDPAVNPSLETFHWGNPDVDSIRTYTEKKFGWDETKCDSMLIPISKNLQCQIDKSKQMTLDNFLIPISLEDKVSKRKRGSKRLQSAVKKLKRAAAPISELNLSSESSSEDEISLPKASTSHKRIQPPKTDKFKISESPLKSVHEINQALHKKPPESSPQKIQKETMMNQNKRKAIEVLKNSKSKKQ